MALLSIANSCHGPINHYVRVHVDYSKDSHIDWNIKKKCANVIAIFAGVSLKQAG